MQVLESDDVKIGYNASTGVYEDMFKAGIIDPAKVIHPMSLRPIYLWSIKFGALHSLFSRWVPD